MAKKTYRVHLQWSGEQALTCYSVTHNTHVVMTSVHALYYNGHINVPNATRVKLSKVGTILPHDHHAELHVIAGTVASNHWEARTQVARGKWI